MEVSCSKSTKHFDTIQNHFWCRFITLPAVKQRTKLLRRMQYQVATLLSLNQSFKALWLKAVYLFKLLESMSMEKIRKHWNRLNKDDKAIVTAHQLASTIYHIYRPLSSRPPYLSQQPRLKHFYALISWARWKIYKRQSITSPFQVVVGFVSAE